jgi:hypothetical protein
MKTTAISIVLTFVLIHSSLKAQSLFCPPGAEWHSAFVLVPAWNNTFVYTNERIAYIRDSMVGADVSKVLSHRFYYATCYNAGPLNKITLLRQKGDTVFFRNEKTQHNWEVLYNFATAPGGNWKTTVLKANGSPVTYTNTVDSVKQVTINGFNLKRLFLSSGATVTERFGGYLFNFVSFANGCDGYFLSELLCYADSTFGTIQFGGKDCNFQGSFPLTSIDEASKGQAFDMFPNPVSRELVFQFASLPLAGERLVISTVAGVTVKELGALSAETRIDLEGLAPGVYFVTYHHSAGKTVRRMVKD